MNPDNPNFRTAEDWERRYSQKVEENQKLKGLLDRAKVRLEASQEWICANHEMPLYSELVADNEQFLNELERG